MNQKTGKAEESKGSSTAGYTCFSRACANRERDERFRGPDDVAQVMLPAFARIVLNVPALRRLFMSRVAPPGIYEYVLARTKLLDEVFLKALEERFAQIVLLGAGFDTRAIRFAEHNQATRVFELDKADVQEPKIAILRRKNVAIPETTVLVPMDFNKQGMRDALLNAGYQEGALSLFIWEGVTMYLNAESVDATLEFIQRSVGKGSIVAFDYLLAPVLRREGRYYGERQIYDTVARAGEGWTFGLDEGEVGGFLSARGFDLLAHYTPSQLEEKYLTAEDGTRFGRINGTHCIAIAAVR